MRGSLKGEGGAKALGAKPKIDIAALSKEISQFTLPKSNNAKTIKIGETSFKVTHETASNGRHIVSIYKTGKDGKTESTLRSVYTNSGSYGYAVTGTRSDTQKRVREELNWQLKNAK